MKILSLAVFTLFAASAAFGQCRADRVVWGAEEVIHLSFKEVEQRESELTECRFVDQPKASDYVLLASVFEREKERRMSRFMDRHGLRKQFIQEDDQGER
jgi:hypothetical protein